MTLKIYINSPNSPILICIYLETFIFPYSVENIITILISNTGKSLDTPSSYRLTNLLAFFANPTEKIILKYTFELSNIKQIIHSITQYGFQNKHSSIHKIHYLTDSIAPWKINPVALLIYLASPKFSTEFGTLVSLTS